MKSLLISISSLFFLTGCTQQSKPEIKIVAARPDIDKKVVEKTAQLLARSEYKRVQAAPGPKVTSKAFGRDRRFPLTSGFRNWN